MKARITIGIGVALSIAIAIATAISPLTAQAQTPPAAAQRPAALSPDVAFGRFIALIRGHLLTGEELAAQRDWGLAQRHFNFPIEEIYGVIREDLRTYQTPPFDGALKALVRVAKMRNAKQFPGALQRVQAALAVADASLKARQPNWPRFVAAVAIEVLKTAPDEYDDAVVKGRIARPIGYQTARGFILQADRMIESVAGEFPSERAAALADIRARLAELIQAFGNVNPPKQAPIDPSAVSAIVSKIETATSALP